MDTSGPADETENGNVAGNNASSGEYKKGVFTETTYESEFVGLRYTAPDGWVNATEAEIAELPDDGTTTWELYSMNSIDGSNVMLAVEKLPMENFTVSMYIESLKSSLESDTEFNITGEISDNRSYNIAGQTYSVLSYNAQQNGVDYSQSYYIRKIDDYIAAIIVTVPSGGKKPEQIYLALQDINILNISSIKRGIPCHKRGIPLFMLYCGLNELLRGAVRLNTFSFLLSRVK